MNRGHFNSKTMAEVRKLLGTPDGHFETRYALAYQLGSDDKNSYQLIFLPDFSGKTVENIKIYHEPISDTPPTPTTAPPVPPTNAITGAIQTLTDRHRRCCRRINLQTSEACTGNKIVQNRQRNFLFESRQTLPLQFANRRRRFCFREITR